MLYRHAWIERDSKIARGPPQVSETSVSTTKKTGMDTKIRRRYLGVAERYISSCDRPT